MIASNQTAYSTKISTGNANLVEIDVSGVEAHSPDEVGLDGPEAPDSPVGIHDGNAEKKRNS